jgi:hypothetical protein
MNLETWYEMIRKMPNEIQNKMYGDNMLIYRDHELNPKINSEINYYMKGRIYTDNCFYYTCIFKGSLYPREYSAHVKYIHSPRKSCGLYYGMDINADNFVLFRTVDPVITPQEKEQGYVSLEKMLEVIDNNEIYKEQWGTLKNDEDIYIYEGIHDMSEVDSIVDINYIISCE